MIAFDIVCSNGHVFECWFKDSASYEEQKSSGIINCPICNDNDVEKVFSPFAIKKNGEKKREEKRAEKKEEKKSEEVHPANPYQALRMINEYLDKHFEEVGANFAKEASKSIGERQKREISKGLPLLKRRPYLKKKGFNSSRFRSLNASIVEATHFKIPACPAYGRHISNEIQS